MGIYCFPTRFSGVAEIYITRKAAIGDASGDLVGFYGDTAVVQQVTPDDAEVTASAITAATQLNLLLDRLTSASILGGT